MRRAPQHPRTGLLGGAALLLVLLGVLAMHGVGGHTAGHDAVPGEHAVESVTTGMVEHRVHDPVTEARAHLATGPAHGSSWTALCLAVLAGAVLLALSATGGVPSRLSARRSRATTPVPGRRDRDPPSLVVLSVCRC